MKTAPKPMTVRKLILAAALILAAIVPAKSQQAPAPFNAEEQKAILWLLKNWDVVKADMDRADLRAGRKLRIDEHIYRWFPFDRTTEDFDRLRMQREKIMAGEQ